jgi:hypothetical protein
MIDDRFKGYRKLLQPQLKSIIDEYLGVSEFIKPMVQKVIVEFVAKEELTKEINFDELFIRLPPFEPITMVESSYGSKDLEVKFVGDYVWFVTAIEGADRILAKLGEIYEYVKQRYNVKCDEIVCGEYLYYADGILLKRLVIPRVIGDGRQKWFKDIRISIPQAQGGVGEIRIIYGFTKETIENWKQQVRRKINWNNPNEVFSEREIALLFTEKERKRRGYVPTTLNYITKCFDGWVMTTDPFAVKRKCTECVERGEITTLRCRPYPGRGIYDYRREIFPRVYAELENIVAETDVNKMLSFYRVPFACLVANHIGSMKRVKAFSTYIDIGRVRLQLKKPIVSQYFDTNGFITLIDRSYVDVFIETIKKSATNVSCTVYLCNPSMGVGSVKLPLINVLVAKFIWKNVFLRKYGYDININVDSNLNTLSIRVKIPGLREEISLISPEQVNKLIEDVSSRKEFRDYVSLVLAHTLAHTMLLGISSLIPEVEDYGVYVSQVGNRYILSGVIENTKGGVLEIFTHLSQKLRTYILNEDSNVFIFKPSVLGEVLREVFTLINSVEGIVKEVVKESCKEVGDGTVISNIVNSIMQSIGEEIGNEEARLLRIESFVKTVVNEITSLFKNTIESLLKSRFYIDRESFTSVILWKLLLVSNIKEKILEHVKKRALDILRKNNVMLHYNDEEEVYNAIRIIFDKLIEVEMTRLITKILLPDYCSDGCDQDLYLANCSNAPMQPYIVSRCLLAAFLRFSGLNINLSRLELVRFDCSGAELETIAQLAKKHLYILTSGFGEDSIKLLSRILNSNPNIKVYLELDQRVGGSQKELINMLEQVRRMYSNRFTYILTSEPHHGKMLVADFLKIHTSWNFGVGTKVLQTYHSEVMQ